MQSVSAADKLTLKVAMECGYAPYNWTQPDDSNGAVQISGSSDYAYGYDVMMAKKIADTLAKTSADFIGDKMEVTPPKIIEEGEVPTIQTSPSTKKNVLIGALAGLVLSAGVIILLTLMDDTIKSEDDIENYLGLTTLASIPDRKDYITGKGLRNSSKTTPKKKKKRR